MPSFLLELIEWTYISEHHFSQKHILPHQLSLFFIFLLTCHPHSPTPHHSFSVWNSQSWSNPEPAWSNVSLPVQWAAHSGWECCPVTVGIPVWCSCVHGPFFFLLLLFHFVCVSLWAFACDLWQLDSYPSVYVGFACASETSVLVPIPV